MREQLTDRQYGRIVQYVHDYVHYGVALDFDNESLRFSKLELKVLVQVMSRCCKLEEESSPEVAFPEDKKRRRGAQPDNRNACKTNLETNKNESETNPETNQNESENESHDHDHSLHLHDHVIKMLEKIKIASEKLGISIENPHPIAEKFLVSGIKSDWFFSQHYDFLNFVVFWLKNHKKYSKKSSEDLRNLFISAVSWQELHQKYPEWREKQELEAAKNEKKALRENYPAVCPHCFAKMQGNTCPSCGGFYTFDEANMKHIFNQNLPFTDITHKFERYLEEKNNQKAAATGQSREAASG
jgi:hypothetical protein